MNDLPIFHCFKNYKDVSQTSSYTLSILLNRSASGFHRKDAAVDGLHSALQGGLLVCRRPNSRVLFVVSSRGPYPDLGVDIIPNGTSHSRLLLWI